MRKLSNIIKSIYLNYQAFRYLIQLEKELKGKLPFYRKIFYLLRGFSSSKYELYRLDQNHHKEYLSDFKRRKTEKINGVYKITLDDKYLFSKLYKSYTAEIYGRIINGRFFIENLQLDMTQFINLLTNKGNVIIKKYRGGGGKGIYRISHKDNKLYLDNQPISETKLIVFLQTLKNHLVMEHLTQLDYSNNIYPETINSMRILTMIDPENNEPFIAFAIHKFGSHKTIPVDNVWKGGLTSRIDIESGVLQKPAYHEENNNKISWVSNHPDTKATIEGMVVPGWDNVKKFILSIAKEHDYLKYVGWDIVLTEKGPKIIEGNNYSDVNILQIHKPLLIDKRVRAFYKYHKII